MTRHTYASALSVFVIALFIMLALGSTESSDVDRGSSEQPSNGTAQTTPNDEVERYSVQQQYVVNGLAVTIGDIEIQSRKVLLGITVKNETNDKLSFYPDQGSIVMGAMQLDANIFMTEGSVSGEIMPGVEKSAVIHFTTPENQDVPSTRTVSLHLGSVYNLDTFTGTADFVETITLD